MATEGGADLRERLAQKLYAKRYGDHLLSDAPAAKREIYRSDADFLFEAIAEAGYVVVSRDALWEALDHMQTTGETLQLWSLLPVESGDLDGPGGGEG